MQQRQGGVKVDVGRPDQQGQLSGGRCVRQTGDRAVQETQPPVLRGPGQLQHPAVGKGRALDGERPVLQVRGEDPGRPLPHRPGRLVVADHDEHRRRAVRRLPGRGRETGASVDQLRGSARCAVVDGKVVAGTEQTGRHPVAHPAQPHERDACHPDNLRTWLRDAGDARVSR